MLEQHNISNLSQIANLTPGLKIDTNAGRGYTFIRGIGTDAVSIGSDPSVAIYSDGVYQPRGTSALGGVWDIDHVEVLKGPQGDLYGRNATGGAILIVTKQAELHDFSGYGDVNYGSFNRTRLETGVNLPISDTMAARVSAMYQNDDGYMHDLQSGKDTGGQVVRGFRTNFLYQPLNDFSAKLDAFYFDSTGAAGATFKVDPTQVDPTISKFGATIPTGKYDVRYNSANDVVIRNYGSSLTLEGQYDGIDIKNVSGFEWTTANRKLDFDATQYTVGTTTEGVEASKSYTESIQLSNATSGRFNWITGIDYLHEELNADSVSIVYPRTAATGAAIRTAINNVNATGAFANVTYEILPKLKLIGGLRYSYEDKHFQFTQPQHGDWKALTPKYGLEYQATRDVMLYATATDGFKSGGFNANQYQAPFGEEHVWSYESGIKTSFLHQRVTANLDGFYYDYRNLQVTQIDPLTAVPVISNAGSAQVKGLEGELRGRVWSSLHAGMNFVLLNTRYGNLPLVNSGAVGSPTVNVENNSFSRAPKTSVGTDASYDWALPRGQTLTLSGDAHYVSRVYFSPFDAGPVSQPHFWLANARLAWTVNNLEFAVLVNNLTNQYYKVTAQAYPANVGTTYLPGESRYVGVSAKYKF